MPMLRATATRERADRSDLVNDGQDLAVRLQLTEQRPKCGLVVG